MKTYIIDTNAILRFILGDVPEQTKKVIEVLKRAGKHEVKIILLTQVIFEIEYVLDHVYGINIDERYQMLTELISTKYIILESDSYRGKLIQSMELSKEKKISLVDALLIITAELNDAEVLTFDKAILKAI